VRSSSRAIERNRVFVGVRGVLIDISEHKRFEEENLRIAKLESLAVLAGGIAHDFNNILTAVTANLSIAAEEDVADEDVTRSIADARRAVDSARALTQQLLVFSKGGEPVKKVVSIGEIVTASAKFALSGAASRLDLSVADELFPVEVDPSQIGRMIENLVINADQAMEDGGTVAVAVENVGPVETEDGTRPSFPPGRAIRIIVSDSGPGIPEEDLQRIFDPYFTTKEQGSGLGLASVHTVVNRHGGRIGVTSEDGQGTTFAVVLPAVDAAIPQSSTPPRASPAAGERVLVMDDEEMVRMAAERALTRLGYEVTLAEDGESALDEYASAQAEGRPYDAVIMDLVIPGGKGGREVIERLLEIDPDARAIVSSGYSTDPIMSNHRAHGFKAAVAKPWDLEQISRTLRKVLGAG
jgi:nitrogen-specific signal transduction histidine kinase/CheY-like chemotaxis protein